MRRFKQAPVVLCHNWCKRLLDLVQMRYAIGVIGGASKTRLVELDLTEVKYHSIDQCIDAPDCWNGGFSRASSIGKDWLKPRFREVCTKSGVLHIQTIRLCLALGET